MLIMVVRHRLVFLLGVLATGVAFEAIHQLGIPHVSRAASGAEVGLVGLLVVMQFVARDDDQPGTFRVRDGAFRAPPYSGAVLQAGMLTTLGVMCAGQAVSDARGPFGVGDILIAALVLLVFVLLLSWYGALRGFGVVLRPEGVLDRGPLGSVFVPWQAGVSAEPTGNGIKLSLVHPELVVRRGFRPGTTIQAGGGLGFTASAINLYASRPDLRTTIGTGEGLRRLQSE